MSNDFERASAVRRRADGVYAAHIPDGWDIGGNANGGFMIALAARAMADAAERPPLSLTAHYLAPGKPGDVTVDVDVLRSGRRTSTAAAVLRSEEAAVLALLGTFGEQVPGDVGVVDGAPPDLPPIEECPISAPPVESGFHHNVRASAVPADIGFRDGRPTGEASMKGWFQLPDERPLDVFALLLATDSFAPVVFNRPEFPLGWCPTLELTVHVRGVPSLGPLRCSFRSRFMQHGMFEEDGEVWDSAGVLVAQSRQLALVPRG